MHVHRIWYLIFYIISDYIIIASDIWYFILYQTILSSHLIFDILYYIILYYHRSNTPHTVHAHPDNPLIYFIWYLIFCIISYYIIIIWTFFFFSGPSAGRDHGLPLPVLEHHCLQSCWRRCVNICMSSVWGVGYRWKGVGHMWKGVGYRRSA